MSSSSLVISWVRSTSTGGFDELVFLRRDIFTTWTSSLELSSVSEERQSSWRSGAARSLLLCCWSPLGPGCGEAGGCRPEGPATGSVGSFSFFSRFSDLIRLAAAAGARVAQTRSLSASWLYAGRCTGDARDVEGEVLREAADEPGLLLGANVEVTNSISEGGKVEVLAGLGAASSFGTEAEAEAVVEAEPVEDTETVQETEACEDEETAGVASGDV